MGKSSRARVRPRSKRTLGSYHETYKSARPKTYWVAISGVDRNLGSIQEYMQDCYYQSHARNKAVVSNIAGMVYAREFNYSNTSIRLSTIHIQFRALGHIQTPVHGTKQNIIYKRDNRYMIPEIHNSTRRSGETQ